MSGDLGMPPFIEPANEAIRHADLARQLSPPSARADPLLREAHDRVLENGVSTATDDDDGVLERSGQDLRQTHGTSGNPRAPRRPAGRMEAGRFAARMLIVVLVGAATIAAHAGETAVAGSIRICRVSGEGARQRGEAIEIPTGASFGDTGEMNAPGGGGRYWPLWIETTEPTRIGASEACGTAKAQVIGNMDRHRVRVADHRSFVPSGSVADGRLKQWPGDLALTATVIDDFR
jgi:hypothetical protein